MPHTLFLADDSVTIQRVIELTFAEEDIDVVAFSDGHRALAALDERRPDIVLADVGMPGPTGYDLARHIRTTPSLSHIPILLLTGAFEPVDQQQANDLKCDGVLTKPFEPQAVIRKVRELLGNLPGQRASLVAPAPPAATAVSVSTPKPAPVVEPGEPRTSMPGSPLDQYFEQLDQAITAKAFDRPAPTRAAPPIAARGPSGDEPTARSGALMVDAFSALLAAEEAEAPDPAAAVRPLLESSAAPVFNEEAVIEQVVRRVLLQLTDRVVKERVTEIVSKTAERLVTEEIERIKSNIK